MLAKIWNWLDGNKTIICAIVIIFLQSALGEMYIPLEWREFLLLVFQAAGLGSLGHHIVKGVKKIKNNVPAN